MLDEDPKRRFGKDSFSTIWPLLLLIIATKSLRSSAFFTAFSYLHQNNFPVVLYVFLVVFFAACCFLVLQRPWTSRKLIRPKHWMRIALYSAVLAVNILFWNIGLKYYGPIRSILSGDYTDLWVGFALGSLFSRKALAQSKLKGACIIVLAYLLLFFLDSSSLEEGTDAPEKHFFDLWFFGQVSESKVGGLCVFLAAWLTSVRKNIGRVVSHEIGGSKRLLSICLPVAALFLAPFALFSYATADTLGEFSFSQLLSFIGVAVFGIVGDYYVEWTTHSRLSTSTVATTSLTASFVFCCLMDSWLNLNLVSPILVLCFMLILLGIHMVFSVEDSAAAFTQTSISSSGAPPLALVKLILKQILSDKESRSIFTFLSINLAFMFVEMVYGVWTNSLGLISDACHMLFDCTALAIGLYASVISRWDRNEIFSYGYGRVQVLSGYINGIFLVFISVSVLLESMERFWEPPEIKTDSLLTVSFLGLCVNLVGIWAFHGHAHDHGGGGGGHGHSHSHGGDKKDKHKEKKDKHKDKDHKHDHDHDHGHAHAHEEHGHSHSHTNDHDHEHCDDHDHQHDHHDHHDHDHEHEHEHEHDHGHGHGHGHKKDKHKDKHKDKKHDDDLEGAHGVTNDNMQGIYFHIIADTLGSVGVLTSSFFVWMFGWKIADPVCSFCISLLIFVSALPLIKNSASTLLQGTQEDFEHTLKKCLKKITAIPGVRGYREAHFWNHYSQLLVGTIHIQVEDEQNEQKILNMVSKTFRDHGVNDMTVQVEKEQFFVLCETQKTSQYSIFPLQITTLG